MTRKSSKTPNPTVGGVRRARRQMPMLDGPGDSTIIRYNATGANIVSNVIAAGYIRDFVPGSNRGLISTAGATLTSAYSTAKFRPGTGIEWQPSVSFTVSGRVVCGFTDNPETATVIESLYGAFIATPTAATFTSFLSAIKGLGSVQSFPVWQATKINFPTRTRRKMFDTNATVNMIGPDIYDRSMQQYFVAAVEGAPINTVFGSFMYRDVLSVEGIATTVT